MNTNNISEKSTDKYIHRIRFKKIDVDTDAAYERLWHKIRNERPQIIGVSRIWKYVSIAASLALLIVSSFYLYTSLDKDVEQMAYVEVSAISGSKTRIELPDSSIVWLNSNSTIRYPQKFTEKNRKVEFNGEALFEIRKDEEKPFIVAVDGLSVEVLGTQFNILVDSDIVETTLLEGSIALYKANNASKNPDKILSPNQQALLNKRNGQLDVYSVRGSMYSSWVSGVFVFEKNTLLEITNMLQRAFDTKIHIEGKDLQNKRLTAQFSHQETLDEILSILQISARYTFKKEKGEIYIK